MRPNDVETPADKLVGQTIERTSPMTGETRVRDMYATAAQWADWYAQPREKMIQDIFPDWSPADREWIKTGYTDSDWDDKFPPEDEL